MNRKEIYEELKMPYDELQAYLIQKYGGAVCDYFATPECKSKSKKISRTGEGLYCHHMDEDKGGNLGNPPQAKMQPFEWQKKERLVYCNILEHLILHIKIAVIRQKELLKNPNDVEAFFTTGGIFMICADINDMFINDGTSVAWKRRCFEEIKENYEDYIVLVRALLAYIDDNYCGEKKEPAFLVPGSIVHFSDCDCEILKITKKRDAFLLKLPTGEEKSFKSFVAINQFKYVDQVNIVTRRMSSGHDEFYANIYNDIINCNKMTEVANCVTSIKVDFTGHGYAQYAGIELTEEFGSQNADEYISKALPMYCDVTIELEGKIPKFWRGLDMPSEARNSFYIIRIETMFNVKKGVEPFIRYRERDIMRNDVMCGMNNNHNLKDYDWKVLATSDIYDKKTNKYYSKYKDYKGNICDAMVTLTLGKDDYLLFKERYNIYYLKILDGCYFC